MIHKRTPMLPSWMDRASREDILEAAVWYQEGACRLYALADYHRNAGSDNTAIRVQRDAADSALLARAALAKATGSQA